MWTFVLVDNDAALKLARYGLLDEALAAMGCTHSQVRVLATARYTMLPSKRPLRFCKDQASAGRLSSFLSQVSKIDPASADAALLDVVVSVPEIHPGEAMLFACVAGQAGTAMLTGDKRAVKALAASEAGGPYLPLLANRVICMETLFRSLVASDFAVVQSRVRNNPEVDQALWNSHDFPDTSNDAKLAAGGVRWHAGKDGNSPRSSSARRSRRSVSLGGR